MTIPTDGLEINKSEVMRYIGNTGDGSETFRQLFDAAGKLCIASSSPKAVARRYPIERGSSLFIGGVGLIGGDIARSKNNSLYVKYIM